MMAQQLLLPLNYHGKCLRWDGGKWEESEEDHLLLELIKFWQSCLLMANIFSEAGEANKKWDSDGLPLLNGRWDGALWGIY